MGLGRGWGCANRRTALLATAILVLALTLLNYTHTHTHTHTNTHTRPQVHLLSHPSAWLTVPHLALFFSHSDHDIMVWSSLYLKKKALMHTSHPIFTLVWRPPPDCAICFVLILYPSLYCPLRDPCRRVNRKALGLKFVCLLFFFFFLAFFLFLFSTHFPPGTSFMICLGNARLSSPSKCLLYVKFVFSSEFPAGNEAIRKVH